MNWRRVGLGMFVGGLSQYVVKRRKAKAAPHDFAPSGRFDSRPTDLPMPTIARESADLTIDVGADLAADVPILDASLGEPMIEVSTDVTDAASIPEAGSAVIGGPADGRPAEVVSESVVSENFEPEALGNDVPPSPSNASAAEPGTEVIIPRAGMPVDEAVPPLVAPAGDAPEAAPVVVVIPRSDNPDHVAANPTTPQPTPAVSPLVAPYAAEPAEATVASHAAPVLQAPLASPLSSPLPQDRLPTVEDARWRPSPGWRIAGSILLAVLVAGVIAASVIRLPYYRFAPGSVYGTIERVEAPGDLVFLPDEGSIGFVTVSQTADISGWQWLDAKLDSGIRLEHEDEVEGDQTAEEQRQEDRRRMQLSKSDAVVVALERLGYELIITPIGVEVAQVFPCTAADGTLGTGDLIVGVNGVEVRQSDELVEQLLDIGIGQDVELLVERIDPNNPTRSISTELVGLTLGSADDSCLADEVRAEEPRPFIGIGTLTIFDEDLPVEVDIETGRVGGPSAGLAFTLAIIDVLSEGELTNGLNVVVTGTITRDGQVGPVGGIQQKTIAAARSGADLFIVPMCCENFVDPGTGEPVDVPGNYEEALRHAGDDMVVVGVDTLDDALRALGALGGQVDDFIVE